jgi:hypothetical protein
MAIKHIIVLFVETPRKFIIYYAVINLRGVSTNKTITVIYNLVPRAFCSRSAKMALASAGHMTSKSPVFGVCNYDNLCV